MEIEDTKLSIGAFDFTPDWAKKDAGVNIGKTRPLSEERTGEKPRQTEGRFNAKKKSFSRSQAPRPKFEQLPPFTADIKVLPDTKALGTIIKKLQHDTHAFKLKDLAYFFLDNPSSVLLKVVPKDKVSFHQCKVCGFASPSADEVSQHILSAHLEDYFEFSEVEIEPPKGNFSCVAKCGLSGIYIGPPNIHDYNSNIREIIRTRYPNMSEQEYRSHIEIVRDAEAIEAWRNSSCKKTLYRLKGAGEDEVYNLTREQAEGRFKINYLPSLISAPKNLMITAEKAMSSPFKPLAIAARKALHDERLSPRAMCFALHGAFHYRKMHFFRVNDSHGQEFVSSIEYKPLDVEHAIPELRKIAVFIAENPCRFKNEIVKEPDDEKHLQWLVTTGHVINFTNGAYAAVEKFPKYGPSWRKDKKESSKATDLEVAAESIIEEPSEKKVEEVKDESAPELA